MPGVAEPCVRLYEELPTPGLYSSLLLTERVNFTKYSFLINPHLNKFQPDNNNLYNLIYTVRKKNERLNFDTTHNTDHSINSDHDVLIEQPSSMMFNYISQLYYVINDICCVFCILKRENLLSTKMQQLITLY